MSGKIRFTMHNQSDLADMVATSETLPINNVKLVPRGKIWRSTGVGAQTITGTFGSTQTISTVTLGRHNLDAGATMVVSLHTGAAGGGSQLATSGTITVSTAEAFEAASDLEYQDLKNLTHYFIDGNGDKKEWTGVLSYKIVLTTGGSLSYFDVGRIIAGNYIEPTYNISYGHNLSYEEKTKQYRTDSGSLRSDIALPFKKFDFSLKTISEDDRVMIREALADVGKRKDFFLSIFPESSIEQKQIDYSAIVKLSKMPRFTEIQANWYSSKYTMEEV